MPATATAFLANAATRLAPLDRALAPAQSPNDVAWALCRFAGKELELVDVIVYLCDPGGRTLTQQAAWGPSAPPAGYSNRVSPCRWARASPVRCAQARLPQRTGDARFDARYVPDDQFNRSELAVPIQCGDGLFGVLDSEHPERDHYTLEHEHALQAIAERGARRLQALARATTPGA